MESRIIAWEKTNRPSNPRRSFNVSRIGRGKDVPEFKGLDPRDFVASDIPLSYPIVDFDAALLSTSDCQPFVQDSFLTELLTLDPNGFSNQLVGI